MVSQLVALRFEPVTCIFRVPRAIHSATICADNNNLNVEHYTGKQSRITSRAFYKFHLLPNVRRKHINTCVVFHVQISASALETGKYRFN